MNNLEWEVIEDISHNSNDIPQEYRREGQYHSYSTIKRCKVYGGWLVRSSSGSFNSNNIGKSSGLGEALTFVPDLKWEWVL